ncbi:Glutamyl-tRNA synthetase @ Glutamyl-tRNA(Gln) synthetase [hydrothermal vent metagenome]|uniref:glutamate--tRNA ligase n=1 Tax=hydrothermal vent metagenome TaxID=652676 RepID=A0A3B1CA90_9ZZZZ
MNDIRVRFAPSPTGALHVGNLRTALYNWLYAKNMQGSFILRIEDTDAQRCSSDAENKIFSSLAKLGLKWDEGPDIGGPHTPYRQSERSEKYETAIKTLLDNGSAYHCYCSTADLEADRKKFITAGHPPRYSGKCRNLSEEERSDLKLTDIKPSVRFKVERGTLEINDGVRGHISFNLSDIGDFIIARSDRAAAYYLASIADDVDMKITDVIRGEDHLSNTPKQILVARALGKTAPRYHHLSIIQGADGKKLSKRSGSLDISTLLDSGYAPVAITTAIAMLGWSGVSGKGPEPLEEMAKRFNLKKVSKAPCHFDPARLDHINAKAIKQMPAEKLIEILKPVMVGFPFEKFSDEKLFKIIDAVKESIHNPSEALLHAEQFIKMDEPDPVSLETLNSDEARNVCDALKKSVAELEMLTDETFRSVVESVSSVTGLTGKKLYAPIRALVTGKSSGPKLVDIFTILGRDEILKRIEKFVS